MSLVTLSEAQDRVGESVTQDNIDEVEEELVALVGPLIGERTETFYLSERRLPYRTVDGVYLSRYANSVTVTTATTGEAATTLTSGTDYRFLSKCLVERIYAGEAWLDVLTATYTPNDEERIRSVIYDWLQYRQTPAGLQSIRIGAYSETYFPEGSGSTKANDPVIGGFLRRLLPAAGLGLTSPFRFATDRRDRTLITGGDGS